MRNQPTITLPKAVDDALDELMQRDRAWFDSHPDRRLRRRRVESCELRSNHFVEVSSGAPLSQDALEVLVVRAPSTAGVRARVFLPLDPLQHEPFQRDAAELAAATTDADFAALLRWRALPL